MCGIAGVGTVSGLTENDPALVERMLATLAHRGPDEQRTHVDSHVALGVRRLSIIDLETGSQPLANEDASVHVSQNGEIYNYVELRERLRQRGHTFRSAGDTEVIAHLYEEYQDDFVDHLNGMFAIALWDAKRRRLLLVRDRLGEKPLYWQLVDGRLTYGSEMKALLASSAARPELDRIALAQYLQYQYIPAPRTIFKGIQKLESGTILAWDGSDVAVRRYWTPQYRVDERRTVDEVREESLALLRDSVRLRLRSDVPVGLFLSGGLDSTMVLALMTESTQQPVRTFTIGFEDAAYDEREAARLAARHFGADHREEIVRLDAAALLPRLVRHFDEPFGDSSALPTFRLADIAGGQLRVVLSGDGGDEAFAGYSRYSTLLALNRFARTPRWLRHSILAAREVGHAVRGHRALFDERGMAAVLDGSSDDRYIWMVSTTRFELRRRLMLDEEIADQDDVLRSTLAQGPVDVVPRVLRADLLGYLPDDLLVKMDRATMASSLEARAPFLDHRLIEFMATVPANLLLTGRRLKPLLREVADSLLPLDLRERPKQGFAVPLDRWFREGLADVYRSTVLSPEARIRDHLDQTEAASLLTTHIEGGRNLGRQLWLLLTFEFWARCWLSEA